MNIIESSYTTLRAIGKDEAWLQKWITERPSRLGLGDIMIKRCELSHYKNKGGRLDFLAYRGDLDHSKNVAPTPIIVTAPAEQLPALKGSPSHVLRKSPLRNISAPFLIKPSRIDCGLVQQDSANCLIKRPRQPHILRACKQIRTGKKEN